jgi:hypothetical protein
MKFGVSDYLDDAARRCDHRQLYFAPGLAFGHMTLAEALR